MSLILLKCQIPKVCIHLIFDARYLARQYRHFSEGRRGFHADDRYGKQMNRLSRSLKDPSLIDDVSAYVAQLSQ